MTSIALARRVLILATGLALLGASPAVATTFERDGRVLEIVDGDAASWIEITPKQAGRGEIAIQQRTGEPTTGNGCSSRRFQNGYLVVCDARGLGLFRARLGGGQDILGANDPDELVADYRCSRKPLRFRSSIAGGPNDDQLSQVASAKPVRIDGGDGSDVGGACGSDDTIVGGKGADEFYGERGDDVLRGGPGGDKLVGGGDDDRAIGAGGHDLLVGCDGGREDTIYYGDRRGRDRLIGGGGQDSTIDCGGADRVATGAGNDALESVYPDETDGSADRLDCGPGKDGYSGEPGDRVEQCERRVPPYEE